MAYGFRRNIFLENRLVMFVTFYYKGYSVQDSTRIIHRYLPKEISELFVYYFWLILPFIKQLRLLALDQAAPTLRSPFLWALPYQEKPAGDSENYNRWPSRRLGAVLK